MKIKIPLLIVFLLLNSCIKEPNSPIDDNNLKSTLGLFILNEGIWKQNNSSLDKYDFENGIYNSNIYTQMNNKELGDLANDLVVSGDSIYIVISTQNIIRLVNRKDASLINSYSIPGERLIRNLALYQSKLLITDLYSNSLIIFNPETKKIENEIEIGAAPEQISVYRNYAIIANSGYGDYLKDHPKASTISIVDLNQKIESKNFKTGTNPIEILINEKRNSFFVAYRNLPSLKDTFGGIYEYDLTTMAAKNHFGFDAISIQNNSTSDTLFFISDYGISCIDFKTNKKVDFIKNENRNDNWYSLAIDNNSDIYIGNAKNYQMLGELLIYKKNNNYQSLFKKYNTGINPNKLKFIR